ncbi:hypothetical protein HDU96_008156 [Phlyctochytrium bullatum]|nr:hypothetical protein HDU96_008156 [Phlyctochytrium bullatum]
MEKIRIFHRNSKEKEKTLKRAWLKLAKGVDLLPNEDPCHDPNVEPRTLENHAGDDMVLATEVEEDPPEEDEPEDGNQQPMEDNEVGFDGHFQGRVDRLAGIDPLRRGLTFALEKGDDERNILDRMLAEIDGDVDSPGVVEDDSVTFDGSVSAKEELGHSMKMQIKYLLNEF